MAGPAVFGLLLRHASFATLARPRWRSTAVTMQPDCSGQNVQRSTMAAPPAHTSPPPRSFSRRLFLASAFLLCLAFAWYGSLVPFQFKALTLDEAVRRFVADTQYSPIARASGSDFVTNVLLFVPIGFFLAGALADRSRLLAFAVTPVVAATGVALSVTIEFTQVFSGGRTPSWNDVIAESIGAGVGAVGWLLVGSRAVDWAAGAVRARSGEDRALRALSLYAAIWVIVGILPLDLTLRPAEVLDKLRAGRIVFSPVPPVWPPAAFSASVSTVLWAVPLGALGLLGARRLGLARGAGLLIGLVLVCGLELLQLLVLSRWTKAYDVTLGAIGVFAGEWVGARVIGSRSLHASARHRPVRPWPLAILAGWLLVLLVRHWSPFEFRIEGAFVRERLRALVSQVPFQGYYWADPLNALVEATTKILLGVPAGAALQLTWWPVEGRLLRTAQVVAAALISTLIFGALELGQVLLPQRYPDLTDILLGVTGSLGGVALARILFRR
jgi:glycopeptide antibiotics resistance protein